MNLVIIHTKQSSIEVQVLQTILNRERLQLWWLLKMDIVFITAGLVIREQYYVEMVFQNVLHSNTHLIKKTIHYWRMK